VTDDADAYRGRLGDVLDQRDEARAEVDLLRFLLDTATRALAVHAPRLTEELRSRGGLS
jgi:hypothetical protein